MKVTSEQTRTIQSFEKINLISAAALLAGITLLGFPEHLLGCVIGAAVAAANVRGSRLVLQRFLASESHDQSAALALLGIKVLCVLACVIALVYLRPALVVGLAVGVSSIVPAAFIVGTLHALGRLR